MNTNANRDEMPAATKMIGTANRGGGTAPTEPSAQDRLSLKDTFRCRPCTSTAVISP